MRAGSRWHPVVSAMLTIAMCGAAVLGMFAVPEPAHATVTLSQFVANTIGTKVRGGECVDLTSEYLQQVYGITVIGWGNAINYRGGGSAGDHLAANGFTWSTDQNFAAGDILVWDSWIDGINYGHVGIWYNNTVYDQNDARHTPARTANYSPFWTAGYLGHWRKGAPTPRYNPIAPGDSGFAKYGSSTGWTPIGGGLYGTGIYTFNGSGTRDNYAHWTFDLSKINGARKYKAEAYITSTHAGTTAADYHINTASGLVHKSVNQLVLSNEWANLGSYSFASGSAWIELDDVTGEPALTKEIAFDAIRLTPYFNFNYSAGTGGTISGTAAQSVIKGANGTQVTAVPKAGYRFVKWSDNVTSAARTDTNAQADKTLTATFAAISMPSVHRFYNTRLGVHFYTADETEKTNTINNLGGTYTYEGVAYGVNPASNTQPLHRFYNRRVGVHFYTASETEKANTINTLGDTYAYEGVAYNVSATNGTGRTAVHRFYNTRTGTHFYTSDEAERQNILNTLGSIYTYEGVGFYLAP